MHRRHLDDESEQVVNERVERLIHECPPRHVRDRLELVVNEELRRHHDEAEHVDAADDRAKHPRVPASKSQK